jgi:predicted nucleic acid-binding protein
MILADTSVWVDHLRAGEATLARLLDAGAVLVHPFVIGELALGHLRQRATVLGALSDLPRAKAATDDEVLLFIDSHALFGRGVGYVDAHLLAGTRLTEGAVLWTRDRRLHGVAAGLGLAFAPGGSQRRRRSHAQLFSSMGRRALRRQERPRMTGAPPPSQAKAAAISLPR